MNEWEWSALEEKSILDHIEVDGAQLKAGDRVRLRPNAGGDVLDIALRGQVAAIESMEQDYEGNTHVCVVLENDPGRDLGMMRQPGHRFFFSPQEIEALPPEEQSTSPGIAKPRVLIAGVGNIFLGDDGFGVEVVRRLIQRGLPETARAVDFGIRGLDLAYALLDGYETTILIDAYPHGGPPGTVTVVEPDIGEIASPTSFVEPHNMHPINVLRMACAMHGPLKRVLVVGCGRPTSVATKATWG